MSSNRGPYTRQISGEEGELADAVPIVGVGRPDLCALTHIPRLAKQERCYVRERTDINQAAA